MFGKSGGFAANLNLSALNGTNGFRVNGEGLGDVSGNSVSSAGDLNGDGFDDLLIGAPGADPNGIDSGASYVIFGGPRGLIDLPVDPGSAPLTLANAAKASGPLGIAALFARAVYGNETIEAAFRNGTPDNGDDDNYSGYLAGLGWKVLDQALLPRTPGLTASDFTAGDLYIHNPGLSGISESEALLAVDNRNASGQIIAGKGGTLVLSFRGTDEGFAAALGEAWTGNGQYRHYEAYRPLIEAALAYAKNAANNIDRVIVTGHSLGGAMADLFTAVDAWRFASLPDVDLKIVSIASPGLDKDAFTDATDSFLAAGFDRSVVQVQADGSIRLTTPRNYYIGFGNDQDRVVHTTINTGGFADDGPARHIQYTPTPTLRFSDLTQFGNVDLSLPNLENRDVWYEEPGRLNAWSGFGAHHNAGIYWKNLHEISTSILAESYQGQAVKFGIGSYRYAPGFYDFRGQPNRSAEPPVDENTSDTALAGTTSADFILGLEGNDWIIGSNGNDLLDGGLGNDSLSGGNNADRLAGRAGNDTLIGGAGNDILIGMQNADIMSGGPNNDTYYVDTARDVVTELLDKGRDSVRSIVNHALAANVENLVLLGTANLRGTGNNLSNVLAGNTEGNTLIGLAGDDTLFGRAGADMLFGNAGKDKFVFTRVTDSVTGSRDQISDFEPGDKIDVSAIDANTTVVGNQAFAIDTNGTFVAEEIRIQRVGGNLLVSFNQDNDSLAEMTLVVLNRSGLFPSDFVL